jgi:hypothetical protein
MTSKQSKAKQEYDKAYNARPDQVKKREMRNQARAEMEKKGVVQKGDNKDIDHKKMLKDGGTNDSKNLRAVTETKNRGWRKGKKGYD